MAKLPQNLQKPREAEKSIAHIEPEAAVYL
jgi:hypothetical protein